MKKKSVLLLIILILSLICGCSDRSKTDDLQQDETVLQGEATDSQQENETAEPKVNKTIEEKGITLPTVTTETSEQENVKPLVLDSDAAKALTLDGLNFGEGFRRGINMGNMLEAPSEGAWGVRVEDSYFPIIKEMGFDFIRLPVKWSNYTSTGEHKISASILKRVDHIITEANKNGLGIILNMHHFDELNTDPEGSEEKLYAIWTQLAEHYAQLPLSVVFEVNNEPHTKLTTAIWNEYQNECIKIIREFNPDRKILVQAGEWGGAREIPNLILPDDPNLLISFHCYDPFNFTHQGADWVDNSNAQVGLKWTGTETEKRDIENVFSQVRAWSEATGIPAVLGEFGAYEKADMESRAIWTAYMRELAESYGFAWAYWEFCSGFGIYDPIAKTVKQPLVDALISESSIPYGSKKGTPSMVVNKENGLIGPATTQRNINFICDSWTGMSWYDTEQGTVMTELGGLDKVTDWAHIYIALDGVVDTGSEFSYSECELTFKNIDNSITDMCVNLDNNGTKETEVLWPTAEQLKVGSDKIRINDDGTTTFIISLTGAYNALKGQCDNGVRLKVFIESVPDRIANYDRIGKIEFVNVTFK